MTYVEGSAGVGSLFALPSDPLEVVKKSLSLKEQGLLQNTAKEAPSPDTYVATAPTMGF